MRRFAIALAGLTLSTVLTGCGGGSYEPPVIDEQEAAQQEAEINQQMEEEMQRQMSGQR